MLAFMLFPHEAGSFSEAIFDVVLLAAVSTPLIYVWVIKPFVTDRNVALAQIAHLAHTDPLTQLANRRVISSYLEKILSGSVRHRYHGGLLLLDLDGFKLVNDVYGHSAGDAVLIEIAKRLQSVVRGEDVVGRLGGDEFVVLVNCLDADEPTARGKASLIAKKLIALVNVPIDFNNKTVQVGASIGIRLLGSENLDAETAITQADGAMYLAKQAGGGRAVFFSRSKKCVENQRHGFGSRIRD